MSVGALSAPVSVARRWRIGGRVQGVGFRPFVYRLAHHYELSGWVRNNSGAVEVHAQGFAERLQSFGDALLTRAPPAAFARLLDVQAAPLEVNEGFRILASSASAEKHIHVPTDLYTCDECLVELRG
jgi:hydrogenase maturation protein HypF